MDVKLRLVDDGFTKMCAAVADPTVSVRTTGTCVCVCVRVCVVRVCVGECG
jgi:hypothetical protein